MGFLPFIYLLAVRHTLRVYVQNTSTGIYLEIHVAEEDLLAFQRELDDKVDFTIQENISYSNTTPCFAEFSDPIK
ncbi:MAG: acylphosphatase [Chlamydiia bacterium]